MVEELAQSNSKDKVLRSEPQREKRQPELLSMRDRLTAPPQVRDGAEGAQQLKDGCRGWEPRTDLSVPACREG